MKKMELNEIALACKGVANGDGTISSICIDSRKIKKGCLFIAIVGENFDGHDFINTAVESGASAVMCHRPVETDVPVITVADTRDALLNLARYYRSQFKIPLVGVTGSVGKTTTKEMACAVLSEKYKTHRNIGNFNNVIGMPLTLFGLDESHEMAIIEMGMGNLGEISKLSQSALPTVGIITNIGVSHIETLGSQENILKAKLEILEGMEKDSTLLLNADDPFLANVEIEGYNIVYFGIDNIKCHFRAYDIARADRQTAFTVGFDGMEQRVVVPTIGIHNVYNALAAFTAGIVLNVPPKDITQGLLKYVPAGMRQRVKQINSITIIEDCYNASPDSLRAGINALMDLDADRRIAVTGDMLELGELSEKAHYNVGVIAAQKGVDMIFTYGEASKETIKGAVDNGLYGIAFDDKAELSKKLIDTLKDGDAVLFKASRGMRLEEVISAIYEEWGIDE